MLGLWTAVQTRNDLNTSKVNDVILGCSRPLGEKGGAIGKSAARLAGWDDSVAGCQIDRFCGSGLEAINMAAARIMSGMEDMIVAGGVESMSRVPMGSAGGALFFDSELMTKPGFVSPGVADDLIATMGRYMLAFGGALPLGPPRAAA